MKVMLTKASDLLFEELIEVDTLKDLEALDKAHGNFDVVVSFKNREVPRITIYDDYLE